MQKEVKVATIIITVKRRLRPYLLPGWQYGTQIEAKPIRSDLTPKDRAVVEQIAADVRKAI